MISRVDAEKPLPNTGVELFLVSGGAKQHVEGQYNFLATSSVALASSPMARRAAAA